MAEIQKRTETVVKSFYRLDLSQDEAEVLLVVLGGVSGSFKGYRGLVKNMYDALSKEMDLRSANVRAGDFFVGGGRFSDQ